MTDVKLVKLPKQQFLCVRADSVQKKVLETDYVQEEERRRNAFSI